MADTQKILGIGDPAFDRILSKICAVHGMIRADFLQVERDIMTGDYCFAFRAQKFDASLVKLASALHRRLNEDLVGEVVRAAVPELSKDVAELTDLILNPKPRIVKVDEREFFQYTTR